jgi:hypothetical protein
MEFKQKIMLALGSNVPYNNEECIGDMEVSIENRKDRRMGYDRRQFTYDMFIPELRSGKCRRSNPDRRQKPRILH